MMSQIDLMSALGWCKERLEEFNLEPARIDPDITRPFRNEAVAHLTWMAKEALTFAQQKPQKAHRWLGFIQGAMWICIGVPISALKQANLPERDKLPPHVRQDLLTFELNEKARELFEALGDGTNCVRVYTANSATVTEWTTVDGHGNETPTSGVAGTRR